MARIHTMEDDITYERVRHLPRRTRVCSVHRQLSWACNKEIQMYEKDSRVTTNNLDRSKTALQNRARELNVVRKQLQITKKDQYARRGSCPAILHGGDMKAILPAPKVEFFLSETSSKCTKNISMSKSETKDNPSETKVPDSRVVSIKRAVSMVDKLDKEGEGFKRRSSDSDSNNRKTVKSVGFERRRTLPIL